MITNTKNKEELYKLLQIRPFTTYIFHCTLPSGKKANNLNIKYFDLPSFMNRRILSISKDRYKSFQSLFFNNRMLTLFYDYIKNSLSKYIVMNKSYNFYLSLCILYSISRINVNNIKLTTINNSEITLPNDINKDLYNGYLIYAFDYKNKEFQRYKVLDLYLYNEVSLYEKINKNIFIENKKIYMSNVDSVLYDKIKNNFIECYDNKINSLLNTTNNIDCRIIVGFSILFFPMYNKFMIKDFTQ